MKADINSIIVAPYARISDTEINAVPASLCRTR